MATGKLIVKSDRARKVTSYYEGEHVSHIVQLMTQPYDFKRKNSIIPRFSTVDNFVLILEIKEMNSRIHMYYITFMKKLKVYKKV